MNTTEEYIIEHKKKVLRTTEIYSRIDSREIPVGENEVRLFVIARNESLRLPYFFKYYQEIGVDRFFLIDNNSTDNTREVALMHENVHIFKIDEEFKNFWNWMEFFLEEYGLGRWCLVVDVDELLFYHLAERVKLKRLIAYLEINKFTALKGLLLDMYSDKPIKDTFYKQNDNPLKICPFFDTEYFDLITTFFDKKRWESFEYVSTFGGMRDRVFGMNQEGLQWYYCLSKVPLLKYSKNIYLTEGMHAINGAALADIECVVFHTKFLQDFLDEVREESVRSQHFNDGADYKIYNFHINQNSNLVLKHPYSVRFNNSNQLTDLGIMKTSDNFLSYVEN